MIKRNRNAEQIHCFFNNQIRFKETDTERLNKRVEKALNKSKVTNKILVEINYKTGSYKLSQLGKFFNSILCFKNRLENSKLKYCRILLKEQFKDFHTIENILDSNPLKEISKALQKEKTKNDMLELENCNDISLKDSILLTKIETLKKKIYNDFKIKLNNYQTYFYLCNKSKLEQVYLRHLWNKNLNEIYEFKSKRINEFDFETKDLDSLISFKKQNFKLKEFYISKKLDSKEIRFLKSLGYKSKSGKLVYYE